ncbi:MAG TPA: cyclic pyranopterin monophosphate synthase MoaC [Dehalococcoidia bacterium]|nr:cyclic pyranopterin monophosphate synthase MoaC [Dehalococcoidia bacterium]
MEELSHVGSSGEAKMVDISAKDDTIREAVVTSGIRMKPETLEKIRQNQLKKGDVLAVARVAGIMAAKKTPDLIPLCHSIQVSEIGIAFDYTDKDCIKITATAKSTGKTGVEMEAMVAASVSALTIYDMCKAIDRGMTIENICLEKKSGGKSGTYIR